MKCLAGFLIATAVSAAFGQQKPAVKPISDMLPADAPWDEMAVTADMKRVYYSTLDGEIRLYDRVKRATSRIADGGPVWDITVAANGSAMGFVMSGENNTSEFIMVVPLDVRTGLATGAQRKASMLAGGHPVFSSDGRLVAFARDDSAGGRSLAVVPTEGGPERILTTPPQTINAIRWSPDSKTLYFSTMGPRGNRAQNGTIYRVSAAGGTARPISQTGDRLIAVSPDGRAMLFRDTGFVNAYVIVDTSGRTLSRFLAPPGTGAFGWTDPGTVLIERNRNPQVLKAVDISTARMTTITDGEMAPTSPAWSPDGRRIAYATHVGTRAAIVVTAANGSNAKTYPVQQATAGALSWSPDGKWILYRTTGATSSPAAAIEVASGKQLEIPGTTTRSHVKWMGDSRHFIVVGSQSALEKLPASRVDVRTIGLDGSNRVVREVQLTNQRTPIPIDDQSMIIIQPSGVRLESIDGTRPSVQLLEPALGFIAVPTVSPDKQWIAFRRNPESNDNSRLSQVDLVKVDGTGRKTIKLPFLAAPDANLWFSPGNREIIIAESTRGNKNPGLYVVNMGSGDVKKLLEFRTLPNRIPNMSLSPDGKTLVFLNRNSEDAAFWSMDVSGLTRR
jgi:uncharacterized repeat protein (TIGR03803 family)